jgi:selenocysteine lyase/cysteine desulfurase
VSVGIDTILRNLVFEPGDVVICFADIYPSYASTLDYLSSRSPLMISKIDYTHPVSDDYICQAFEAEVKKLRREGKNPKLAMFDTISSLPGVRMPFERLTALCKDLDVMSLVDGAHGVGQIPLRIGEMDPDFFVSNLHKWLYVPRGCAVLYVPERNQHLLHATLPTGFGYGQGFVRNFSDMGTLDNSSFLCVKAALEWRKRLVWRDIKGEEAIFEYLPHLAREGGKLVAEILGTELLDNKEGTLGRCSLTNVRVPISLREVMGGDEGVVGKIETWMMTTMTVEYETAVKFFTYDGAWWVRLSAQVYLTVADFEYVARGLKETCERVERGEWRA